MPSTYTTNNGIELIATGEQSGTWGETTNTNLQLLDASLDGQVTVTLASAGSSGSPNDLPVTNGSASNGRNRVVIFNDGGDLGATAYVQLTPNDAEKIVYIRNSLSGSRDIIVFQGTYNASNDYVVPNGTTAVVFFDGAGTGAVAANLFNNAAFDALQLGTSDVSVNKILDQDDMSGNDASALATQQSIKAYVDSQVGSFDTLAEVLAQGNTTGGTDIAVGTGDDITFADSSKAIFGAGSDLQIYHDGSNSYIKESGAGQLIIAGSDKVQIYDPTISTLSAQFDTNGSVKLYENGSEKLATTSTGIDVTGTAVTDGVTVAGNILLQTEGNELQFNTSSTPVNKIYSDDTYTSNGLTISADNGVALKSTNNYLLLDDTGTNEMVLNVDSGERMRVTSTGIDVTGVVEATGYLAVEGTSGNTGVGTDRWIGGDGTAGTWFYNVPTGSNHYFAVNNTNKLAINSTGIDVTGSLVSDGLTVDGTATTAATFNTNVNGSQLNIKDGTAGTQPWNVGVKNDGTNDFLIYNLGSENIELYTTGKIRQKIADNGDISFYEDTGTTAKFFWDASAESLGLGTSSPSSKLSVSNAGAGGLEISPSYSGTRNLVINYNRSASAYTGVDFDATDYIFYGSGAERLRIDSSGTLITKGAAIFNEDSADADFRVESDTNTHMLFMDATNNRVNIGTTDVSSQGTLAVNGSAIFGRSSTTTGDFISPGGGNNSTYNGVAILSNSDEITAQANTSLSSWIVDIGGRASDGVTYPVATRDAFGVRRVAAGGAYLSAANYLQIDAGEAVFNEDSNDQDFRVESNNNANMLYVDGGNDRVGIGESGPLARLHLKMGGSSRTDGFYITRSDNDNHQLGLWTSGGAMYYDAFTDNASSSGQFRLRHSRNTGSTTTESIFANDTNVVINDGSVDMDFRVESDGNANMLFVDGGANHVNIGTASDFGGVLNVNGGAVFDDATTFDPDTLGSGRIAIGQINDGGGFSAPGIAWGGSGGQNAAVVATAGVLYLGVGNASSANNMESAIELRQTEVSVNNTSLDTDFRVESDSNAYGFFLDASKKAVGVNFDSNPGAYAQFGVRFSGSDSDVNSTGLAVQDTAGANNVSFCTFFNGLGAGIGSITRVGTTNAVAYNTTSDRRAKENIADADDAGAVIDAIQVRKFDWIEGNQHQPYGMIAQELVEHAPEVVHQPVNEEDMMGVDYSKLVPMLIKEIQSLRARVAQLENT